MRRSIFMLMAASALAIASPAFAQSDEEGFDEAAEGDLGEAFDLEGLLGGLLGPNNCRYR